MRDVLALLTALQFGDGQFPGGGFAFSWGLEALIADGRLTRAGFADFVTAQLGGRWRSFDRVIIAHAHEAGTQALTALDEFTDACLLGETIRSGSRRAGATLLDSHARLGTPGAASLQAALGGQAHLPVVQGAVLAGAGLDLAAALATSAYALAQSYGTAGIRLGLIGHLDAQRTLARVRPLIAAAVAAPVPPLEAVHAFTPLADIAAMRHATQTQRLFAN